MQRIKLALRRGSAKGDTWVAAVALWFSGWGAANESWVLAVVAGIAGLAFLVASGDYAWRKGYVVGKQEPRGR